MAGILEMTGRGIRCGDIVMCPEMEEMKMSYDVFVFHGEWPLCSKLVRPRWVILW